LEDLSWAEDLEKKTGALVVSKHGVARLLARTLGSRLLVCGEIAFVLVLLVLAVALRRPRLIAAAALPLVVGLVWSLGLLSLLSVSLNPVNFLVPVLTFGLAVDYAIFLANGYALSGPEPGNEIAEAQGAVVASEVTTLAGMASLLLASHPALFSTGVVALVGTGSALVAIFLITPGLSGRRRA
jgi:predicted RND superfamily exporter protein